MCNDNETGVVEGFMDNSGLIPEEELKEMIEQIPSLKTMTEHIIGCMGCERELPNMGCKAYANPQAQQSRVGGCAMRTHNRVKVTEEKGFIDPLKASKKSMKAKK